MQNDAANSAVVGLCAVPLPHEHGAGSRGHLLLVSQLYSLAKKSIGHSLD